MVSTPFHQLPTVPVVVVGYIGADQTSLSIKGRGGAPFLFHWQIEGLLAMKLNQLLPFYWKPLHSSEEARNFLLTRLLKRGVGGSSSPLLPTTNMKKRADVLLAI